MKLISKQITKKMLFAAILTLLFLAGCKKEKLSSPDTIPVKGSTDALIPYSFNWEDPNLNWMPYPEGQARISLPWTGQGSLYSTVDPDVLTDRKASDGWILLYNTFSPTTFTYNPYFILYNKYRGLMRIFIYVNNSSFASSSYLKNAITLNGNQYSILNFAGTDIVDVSQNQIRFDKIESAPIDGSAPFSTFKWYMLQYELAYDPTIVPTTSENPPQLSFYINSIDITQVKLGGNVEGKLKGSIGATGSSDLFSTITSNIAPALGKGVLAAVGSEFFTRNTISETTNSLGLPNGVFKAISSGISSALSAAAGNLPGAVYNILSAIIGGSSGSAGQTVSLNLNATISLAGSMKDVTCLPSMPASYYLPGSLLADAGGNYNVQGYVPLYNQPVGLFNLSDKPTIYKNRSTPILVTTEAGDFYEYTDTYTKNDVNSLIIFNPNVINSNSDGAHISNLTSEIVLELGPLYGVESETIYGRLENYNDKDIYTDEQSVVALYLSVRPKNRTTSVAVRVSFNVIPNNGGPTSTIVKTFLANFLIQ
jgi:hypothetical protein